MPKTILEAFRKVGGEYIIYRGKDVVSFDQASEALEKEMAAESQRAMAVLEEVGKRIVGQHHVGKRLLMAIIAQGHVLLEGLPGLAKTSAIKALADATNLHFKRIQFTPDLLPADVIGTQIYDPQKTQFSVKQGPIFANLVLADEINRAPAKVQSALLEAMQERQVTIGDQTFFLNEPFLVMATQNPIEQEGTYTLPEAQLDRFLFKIHISYGTPEEEAEIIRRVAAARPAELNKVVSPEQLVHMRQLAEKIYVSDKVRGYIVDLVFATREPKKRGLEDLHSMIECGASPRASICLDQAARVNAMLEGRTFVTPQDIKDVGMDVLRHRVRPTFEAEADNVSSDQIVARIFERVDVP